MKENPGCTIVGHRKGSGTCYRLRDAKVNPVMNLTESEFKEGFNQDYFIKVDNSWTLNN